MSVYIVVWLVINNAGIVLNAIHISVRLLLKDRSDKHTNLED